MTDALRIGWTQARSQERRRTYRLLLGLDLAIRLLVGLAAIIAPVWLMTVLHFQTADVPQWFRIWGGMQIVFALLLFPGWWRPLHIRWPNAVGIGARLLMAVLYFFQGRDFLWFGVYELAAALILGITLWRMMVAELMTRP